MATAARSGSISIRAAPCYGLRTTGPPPKVKARSWISGKTSTGTLRRASVSPIALNDRTAVRGGYGIFTATNQFDHVNVLQLNPPMAGSITVINPTLNPVATIQNPVPVALVSENPLYNVVSIQPDRKHINPYIQNWNIQVSRQLGANNALEVGYVGNKGTFLDTSQLNFNSPDPGTRRHSGSPPLSTVQPHPPPDHRRQQHLSFVPNALRTAFQSRLELHGGL